MKISRFVIIFEREDSCFLYNTGTQSFFRISNADYQQIASVINKEKEIDELPDNLLAFLQNNHCIDNDNEQLSIDLRVKMEYKKRMESFSNRTLSLVIAPTLACNFACPYCYESNLPVSTMTDDVEDQIIRFIKSYEETCDDIELCWEGGEPLMAFGTIRSVISKIETQSSLKIRKHILVTNGYLLTPEICSFFKDKNLDIAQITVDGSPATHNQSRIHKSGKPTYDAIVRNIDMLTDMIPDCRVTVRTNIHNGNKGEYGKLYIELTDRWKGKKVTIAPAFVMDNGNCKISCCSPREKSEFYLSLQRNYGIDRFRRLPKLQTGRCSATAEHSYIIDPKGDLYKCWNDIGKKDYCIGNVSDGVKNNNLIAKYVIGSDKYSDKTCIECKLFPICDGGCNKQRIDNKECGTQYVLCPFDEEGICDELYEYYKSKTS